MPKADATTTTSKSVTLALPLEMLEKLDNHRRGQGDLPTRQDAMRRLLDDALDQQIEAARKKQQPYQTDLSAFEETIDQLDALAFMLGATLEESNLSPSAAGIQSIFRGVAAEMRFHMETVREDCMRLARPASAPETPAPAPETLVDMRERREANIRQIMRDVDYAHVARARGMEPGDVLDILYQLMAAPQKANPGAKTLDTMMPSPSQPTVEGMRTLGTGPLPDHMRPVDPVQPLDDHFTEEAILARLTGGREESETG